MTPYQKTFIELAIKNNALRFGEFTLKSGRISPYFFNVGQLNSGSILKILGECYAHTIEDSTLQFDVLFGPAYKGIPIVCATAIAYSTLQKDIPYAFDRKEIKDHGEGGQIIGTPLKGRVLILDDVITAGTALRASVQLIQAQGASIAGVIVALDRQEQGLGKLSAIQEMQNTLQVPVKAIITFTDILDYISNDQHWAHFHQPMMLYRQQYGAIGL